MEDCRAGKMAGGVMDFYRCLGCELLEQCAHLEQIAREGDE